MDQSITDLDLITKEQMNNSNLLFIQDVIESETKNITVSDLNQYVISSSNILSNLRSGSFSGSFSGIISGSTQSSSYSDTSKYSLNTFLLNYTDVTNNGSSSYSINSLSSSLSLSSSFNESSSLSLYSPYSDKTSYVAVLTANTSSTSISASNSDTSSYSNSSLFLNYNGKDNGTCLHSIISETSTISLISKNLTPNNTSTSSLAISSSHALFAEQSFYIQKTEYAKNSSKSIYTSKNVYAYINFQVVNTGQFNIYSWKNIRINKPIEWQQTGPFGLFHIYFDKMLDVGSTTTVVSDWNFENERVIIPNNIFKPFSFPNKRYGMSVGIWSVNISIESPFFDDRYLKWNDRDPSTLLIGSTFSVIAYKSTEKFPKNVSLGSTSTILQVGGCASL